MKASQINSRRFWLFAWCGVAPLALVTCADSAEKYPEECRTDSDCATGRSIVGCDGYDCRYDPPVEADKCPGEKIALMASGMTTISGSFDHVTPDYRAYCGEIHVTPDAVYTVHVPTAGSLFVDVENRFKNGGVVYSYAAGTCGDPKQVTACRASTDGTTRLAFAVVADKDYSIVIGGTGYGGEFNATVTVQPARCGDAVINEGEDCDFGPDGGRSGCDATTCKFLPPKGQFDVCPGEVLTVDKGQPIHQDDHNSGYHDDYQRCGALAGGPDRVYRIIPQRTGTMTVTVTADFDAVLAAYLDCRGAVLDGLLRCSDQTEPLAAEKLVLEVKSVNSTYYVVVDGHDARSYGRYTLDVTME